MLKNTHASVNTLKHNPPQTCIVRQCMYPHHWNTPHLEFQAYLLHPHQSLKNNCTKYTN